MKKLDRILIALALLFSVTMYGRLFVGAHDATPKKPAVNDRSSHHGEPRSPMWPKVRSEHLKNNPVCAACGQADDLNVHHIKPFHFDPSRELDPDNLITLCTDGVGHTDCHLMFGHGGNFKCANENVVEDAKRFREMLKSRVCETTPAPKK